MSSSTGPGVSQTNTYNGLDTRVGSTTNSAARTFLRDGSTVTDPVLSDGAAVYTPGVSERRGTATTFLHSGLKNALFQTGTAQTLAATRQYDAFGNVTASTGTWRGPFGYAGAFGYQEDATGLRLLGHRYYDSSTGRFLTRDPIKDGRNWYGYCDNDPVYAVDPEGLAWYYDISTGQLSYLEDGAMGPPSPVGAPGFSGKKGRWRNNAGAIGIPEHGPLPDGRYRIGPPRNTKSNGRPLPYNLPLTPAPSNNMRGRSHFLIHGGDIRQDPSQGCIILPRNIRERIWNSGDRTLVVQP